MGLSITGEPQLKPYDVVYLYDSYNDVSGPIEVEQVTHIFSQETGFVTSIIPDLCVQTNKYASASLINAKHPNRGNVSPKTPRRICRAPSEGPLLNPLKAPENPWLSTFNAQVEVPEVTETKWE